MDVSIPALVKCVQARIIVCLLFVFIASQAFSVEVLNVYTVNYPLAYFAQRIGGKHVKVQFPAPRSIDPAYWTPDVRTVGEYQAADLILLNGAGYAKWTQKVSLPRSRIVNTSTKFAEQFIIEKSVVTHSHGPGGDHSHSGIAFTTWLDMRQAVMQADAITHALIRKQPHNETEFVSNFDALERDLLGLEKKLIDIFAKNPHQPILASHPVYQYLARRYNLSIKSMLWEPDEFPGPALWSSLSRVVQNHPATLMFWEAKPLTETVNTLAQKNIRVAIVNPCSNVPQEGDFLSVMQQNIQNLKRTYSH